MQSGMPDVQRIPDDERVVIVAALVAYIVRMQGLPDEVERAKRVMQRVVGVDSEVWVSRPVRRWVLPE